MSDNSDEEVSDLDIEYKTWKKLEKNIKSIGFLEGAAKGKKLSLQEGFNLGYLDGFTVGKYLGIIKGVLRCESELELSDTERPNFEEETLNLKTQICAQCSNKKISDSLSSDNFKTLEDLVSTQRRINYDVVETLKNLDSNSFLEKG